MIIKIVEMFITMQCTERYFPVKGRELVTIMGAQDP